MEWLIWSIEHTAWWAPRRHGSTRVLGLAGRYELAEAREIVRDANIVAFHECMIPDVCVEDGAQDERE